MIPETDDPIKSQLLQKAAHQREELESDFKQIADRTEKAIGNALIIGGTLALAYLLVKSLSGTSKKKRKGKAAKPVTEVAETDEDESSPVMDAVTKIGAAIATQASVVLLNLAKEKLIDYLESRVQQHSDEHSQ